MDFSLMGLWAQMGLVAKLVVIILLVMSMLAIGVSAERILVFRRSKNQSIQYIAALQPLIGASGKLHEAANLSSNPQWKDAPLARVLGAGIREFGEGLEQFGNGTPDAIDLEVLNHGVGRTMDRSKKREMSGLGRGLPLLATIASSAPFVGLFGTVFGIITAFEKMADPSKGGGGLATVSAGIAEALLTTAVGLAVAIVAVWFYNYFAAKVEELGGMLDDASGELVDRLLPSVGRTTGAAATATSAGSHAPAAAGLKRSVAL